MRQRMEIAAAQHRARVALCWKRQRGAKGTQVLQLLRVCLGVVGLIFFKQSRRESLVLTYALDEVCLASADGFVNGAEALFELGAR